MLQRRETLWRVIWLGEAGLVSWFTMQALRFLFGAVYAHVSSADMVLRLGDPGPTVPGVVTPAAVQVELIAVALALLVPLLAFVLGGRAFVFPLAASVAAVGRVFMTLETSPTQVIGAAVVIAGGVLFWAATARQYPTRFAAAIILGLLLDQGVRAFGQTLDPTWSEGFLGVQTILSALLVIAALAERVFGEKPAARGESAPGISLWGGLALGAILFLQSAILGLPNAVAHWSGIDYAIVAPWLAAVTALPLVPEVRDAARRLLTLVDAQWRGWFWMLLIGLLVVIGGRIAGIPALVALLLAQLLLLLALWWVVHPAGKRRRDMTGLAMVIALLVLVLLVGADFFTYEYAFVRDFGGGLAWLSRLLRSLRGLGLGVALLAVAFSAIPLMDEGRRIPWQRGRFAETAAAGGIVVITAVLVTLAALPPAVSFPDDAERLRVATYNIHGGYSLYFHRDLAAMADVVWESGADVLLLQEVDGGRLTSYGTDQALWLGRRLGMNVYFFPTNEKLQGLAVLSRVPVALEEGMLLTSQGLQTGLQRVQLRLDESVLDIYNTWLGLLYARDEAEYSLQEQDQWQQLQEVLGRIAADHPGGVIGRVMLAGTLNNTPDSPVYDLLVEIGFSDPFDGMSLDRAATLYRGAGLIARFDYLWLRNLVPTGRAVLDGAASDHRLVVVELDLGR